MLARALFPVVMVGALCAAAPAVMAQDEVSLAKLPPGVAAPTTNALRPADPPIAREVTTSPRTAPLASATDALLNRVLAQQAEQAQQLREQIDMLRPKPWDKWLPAIFGLLGTIVGAVSGYCLQKQRLRFDRRAARQAAGIKEVSEIKQFRSRQINEFYAPLQALLKQGLVVRNEMYGRLLASNVPGVTFTRITDEKAAVGWSLGIQRAGGEVKPFRLIDEMSVLQQSYPHLMGNVGESVRINDLIVKLVHEKVGLVLHENSELSQQLGILLAHQSVLKDVYRAVTTLGASSPPIPEYTTTFPRDLQRLVQEDCDKLRNELKQWQQQVTQWMDKMAADGGR